MSSLAPRTEAWEVIMGWSMGGERAWAQRGREGWERETERERHGERDTERERVRVRGIQRERETKRVRERHRERQRQREEYLSEQMK